MANGQPTWRSIDEGKACLLDEYQVKVGVWIVPHSIIGAGEGGRVFREGSVLLELSLVHVHREKKKKKQGNLQCSECTHAHPHAHHLPPYHCCLLHHVAAAVVCWVRHICVSHYGRLSVAEGEEGTSVGWKDV